MNHILIYNKNVSLNFAIFVGYNITGNENYIWKNMQNHL